MLYLTIGVTVVALYTFLGLLVPDAFSGISLKDTPTLGSTMIFFSFGTLTTVGAGDLASLHPLARSPHQHRGYDRSALSRDIIGEDRNPRD